jgi:hypothetical protein
LASFGIDGLAATLVEWTTTSPRQPRSELVVAELISIIAIKRHIANYMPSLSLQLVIEYHYFSLSKKLAYRVKISVVRSASFVREYGPGL